MTRWQVYGLAVQMGAMTVQDVQREEGIPVTAPARPTPAPAAPPATDPAQQGDELAARRARAGFDGAGPRTFEFSRGRAFNVDPATRTIAGLALPWGGIATKYGFRYRFERGSIGWPEDTGRVKMLRDHDFRQPLGRALSIADGDEGLQTAFKIGAGPDRDAALADAADGIIDGLSVGVDFSQPGDPGYNADDPDVIEDPDNPGVMLVRRAVLREVSITPLPAFDDARVTTVQASATSGGSVPPIPTPVQPPAQHPAAPAPVQTFHAPPAAPAPPGINQAGWDMLQALYAQQQPAVPEPPAVISPTGFTGAQVQEPEPYRVDFRGRIHPGSHDFSTDVFAHMKGDAAAGARVEAFLTKQFDVVTTDVNELNPTAQRPDMYVKQREYDYPIWRAISKGTLSDVTPFTFPKFSSSSGLVANHTEGVEPSSGTYVTTSQTVTPTPVSGKMKISRETVDQGGNPQVSGLIWSQMLLAWYEALEAFAVSTLDAASPTQIDFSASPGLANDDLDQALTDALIGLQFIRGGFSMDTAFTQIDLYKALAAATDGEGRRLYPALGPANALGTARGRWSALDVNGLAFLPAWALAATGTVAASSYLFDSAVVHGWASAPRRLDFEYEVANVYIGLWGYKAAAISDIAGVREIVYDPA
jgi:HK97 family phage prohead protease